MTVTVSFATGVITYLKADASGTLQPVYTVTAGEAERRSTVPWAFLEAIKAGDVILLRTLNDRDPSVLSAKAPYVGYLLRTAAIVHDMHTGNPVTFDAMGIVNELFDAGIDVDMLLDSSGAHETALHWAASVGAMPQLQVLVARGAKVNVVNRNNATPRYLALVNGHDDAAAFLREHGGKTLFDPSPLLTAVAEGNIGEVKRLLRTAPQALNQANKDGRTPLSLAVSFGLRDIAELLIAQGADVQQANAAGVTPLHLAAWRGSAELGQLLLAHGARIDARTRGGETPLHYAVHNLMYQSDGGMPERFQAMLELLLRDGASVNIDAPACRGTALLGAVWSRNVPLAELLLAHGALVNATDKDGDTALHIAANFTRQLPMVEALVERNANVNAETNAGDAVLDNVTTPAIRTFLLQHGAQESLHRSQAVSGLGVTQDGRHLVTFIADTTMRAHRDMVPERCSYHYVVRDLHSGKVELDAVFLFSNPIATGSASTLAFLPDGHSVLARGTDFTLSRIDVLSGKSLPINGEWQTNFIRYVAGSSKVWTVDATEPAQGEAANTKLVLKDFDSGITLREVALGEVHALEVSRKGALAVTLTGTSEADTGNYHDAVFHFIDLRTGKERTHTPELGDFNSAQMNICSDEHTAAILLYGGKETRLTLWDVPTGRLRKTIPVPADRYIGSFLFSPDKSLFVYTQCKFPRLRTPRSSDIVTVYGLTSGEAHSHFAVKGMITFICFLPDSRRLALTAATFTTPTAHPTLLSPVQLWQARTGKLVKVFAE